MVSLLASCFLRSELTFIQHVQREILQSPSNEGCATIQIVWTFTTLEHTHTGMLTPHGLLFRLLALRLFLFLFQKLLLLLGTHPAQLAIALFLLELIAGLSSLERLLIFVNLLDLANLLLACGADFAKCFWTEMGACYQLIG